MNLPHIDPNAPHAAEARKAETQMAAAGVDPATIATIVQLILQYGPQIAAAIAKLFHHQPPAPTP